MNEPPKMKSIERIYREAEGAAWFDMIREESGGQNQINSAKVRASENEIELLRLQLKGKNEVIADLRRRLDRETEERMRLTALPTHQL